MWNRNRYIYTLDEIKRNKMFDSKEVSSKEQIYKILAPKIGVSIDTVKSWTRQNSTGPGDELLRRNLENALSLEPGALFIDAAHENMNDEKREAMHMNFNVSELARNNIYFCYKVLRMLVMESSLYLIDFHPDMVENINLEILDEDEKVIYKTLFEESIGEPDNTELIVSANKLINRKKICIPNYVSQCITDFLVRIQEYYDKRNAIYHKYCNPTREIVISLGIPEKYKTDEEKEWYIQFIINYNNKLNRNSLINMSPNEIFKIQKEYSSRYRPFIYNERYKLMDDFNQWADKNIHPYLI